MAERDGQLTLRFLLHALFLISGTATVFIGPFLPIVAAKYSLTDLQLSFYFPAQFAGSLAGTWITGRLARRGKYVAASALGAFVLAAGLLVLNFQDFALSLLGFVGIGAGIGLTLSAINITIIELHPLRISPALSVLNFCWGIGAIAAKPYIDVTYQQGGVLLTTVGLAIAMLALGTALIFQPSHTPHAASQSGPEDDEVPIWSTPLAWAIALFNFIHVGYESSMGGWLVTYTDRVGPSEGFAKWVSPMLLYFVFFVAGRGLATFLFRFLNENKMLLLGLFIVLAGMIVCVTATTLPTLAIGASIAGFGTSWIFPTNVSRFTQSFGRTATRHATPLFICGTLGSAALTWLIGFVSDRTGNLRIGMNILVVSIVLLIFLQIALSLRGAKPRGTTA